MALQDPNRVGFSQLLLPQAVGLETPCCDNHVHHAEPLVRPRVCLRSGHRPTTFVCTIVQCRPGAARTVTLEAALRTTIAAKPRPLAAFMTSWRPDQHRSITTQVTNLLWISTDNIRRYRSVIKVATDVCSCGKGGGGRFFLHLIPSAAKSCLYLCVWGAGA